MAKMPSGLGRGLGALLGEAALRDENEESGNREGGVMKLPLTRVENNSAQPRKRFDEEELASLAESIRLHGMIQPLTVRKLDSGFYQIIAGERRWRAARLAGLDEVPVVVMDVDDRTAAELALVENLQREDLNPIEEASGYQMLIRQYHLTQEEVSGAVGKSRSAVANALRLLDLSETVRKYVEAGTLSAGHARTLVVLPAEVQEQAAAEIIEGGLSVRQAEALAKRLNSTEKEPAEPDKPKEIDESKVDEVDYTIIAQRDLSNRLGRGVRIVNGRKKGRIELDYYGLDDLNDLLDELSALQYRNDEKGLME